MAESEEQELIPETEAVEDAEATAQVEEKPLEDEGDEFPVEGGVESAVEAAETEAEPALEEEERPPEEQEYTEQPTEEMAETSEEPVLDVPEAPAEEPTGEETPADADIDEPAVLQPETERSTEDEETEPATDMQALEQCLTEFRHCIENIGTQLDDEMNRQDMRKLRAKIRERATRMENDLKERQKVKDQMDPQERIHLQQVIKQLDNQLNTYHELLERERAMTRRYPLVGGMREDNGVPETTEPYIPAVTIPDEDTRAVNQAATPSQAQAMLKANLQDREHEHVELMELEHDITGLQDIQTDLATLIGEQADDIKLIEQNVEKSANRVEHGHSQMQQSVGFARGSRKMLCVVGTIVTCVATVVIILAVIVVAVILTR